MGHATRKTRDIIVLCLAQLNFTEKGLRKMMEMSKSYRQSLGCEEVLDTFKVRLKPRNFAGTSARFL